MERDNDKNDKARQDSHPGAEPVAENPNPRANENIRARSEEPGTEKAGIEDEVGTEITDGEDA